MIGLHRIKNIRCYHCDHAATFSLHYALPAQEKAKYPRAGHEWDDSATAFSGLFACENCRSPTLIAFEFKTLPGAPPENSANRIRFLNRIEPLLATKEERGGFAMRSGARHVDLDALCAVTYSYPSVVIAVPDDLPPDIARYWAEEIAQILGRAPRFTVIGCRAAIEMMCKDKRAQGNTITSRIDALVHAGVLAKDVAEWAHAIRLLGNDAVHDGDPVSFEVASEVYDFTRVIAELMYSYPARIARLRQRNGPHHAAPPVPTE